MRRSGTDLAEEAAVACRFAASALLLRNGECFLRDPECVIHGTYVTLVILDPVAGTVNALEPTS